MKSLNICSISTNDVLNCETDPCLVINASIISELLCNLGAM